MTGTEDLRILIKRNFTLGPSQASKGGNSANEGKPMYNFIMDKEKFVVDVGSIIQLTSKGTIVMQSEKNFTQTAVTGEMSLKTPANKNRNSSTPKI